MSKFNSLQFKISMIILVPFFIMLMISGAFNILSVRNVTRKLSYRVLEESAKGEAAKVENLVQEALDSLKTFEYIVNDANEITHQVFVEGGKVTGTPNIFGK